MRLFPVSPRNRRAAAVLSLLAAFACTVPLSCSKPRGAAAPSGAEPASVAEGARQGKAAEKARDRQARDLVAAMSLEDLASHVLMVSVAGSNALSEESRAYLAKARPGAIILFSFNLSSDPATVASFTSAVAEAAGLPCADAALPPFIAIDHEGGTVFRFKAGVTRLPSASELGRLEAAPEAAATAGRIAGGELRALGITLNLAPVAEASAGPAASFLEFRAWSADPSRAGALAARFAAESERAGCAAAVKHFPGMGGADPHAALDVLDAAPELFESRYLGPFREALAVRPAAVMLSHVLVRHLDAENPVPLSSAVVGGLLKGTLGFDGIAMSDDLAMKALGGRGSLAERAVLALGAGVDMVMVTGGASSLALRDAIARAVNEGRLPRERLEDAVWRIVRQKLRFGLLGEDGAARAARFSSFADLVAGNAELLRAATAR